MPPEDTEIDEKASETEAEGVEAEGEVEAVAEVPNVKHKDPLHGVTLEALLTSLVEKYGWETLGNAVPIRCFQEDPSIASSLKFLRRNLWAREKVEQMYITNDVRPAWKRRGRSSKKKF